MKPVAVAAVVAAAPPAPRNHRLDRRPRSRSSLDRDNPWIIIKTRDNFFKFRLRHLDARLLPTSRFFCSLTRDATEIHA